MGFSLEGSFLPTLTKTPDFLHRALIVFLTALPATTAWSSQAQFPSQLAAQVDRHYNQCHSLRADFTETYQGLGIRRTESGTLLLAKPGRMRWQYQSPAGKILLLDGKFAFFYTPGDPQIQRIPAKQLDDLRSPLRFLLGRAQLARELDNLTAAPAPNTAPGSQFLLTGQPKGLENRVQRFALTVTPDGTILAIQIVETDGAETLFQFSHQQPNAPIPHNTFHFTPPSGLPVVDTPATP